MTERKVHATRLYRGAEIVKITVTAAGRHNKGLASVVTRYTDRARHLRRSHLRDGLYSNADVARIVARYVDRGYGPKGDQE